MVKPYAEVIGDPIAHSKSPIIHRFWLDKLGIEGDFVATRVRAEALSDYIESRRHLPDWRGCNVTVPHKQAIIPYLDALTPLATQVGAVNLVVPRPVLTGANSDVEGITGPLGLGKGAIREACLIGSGGAALAALAAFHLIGVSRVTLNVRDPAKGQALLATSGFRGRVGPVDDRANIHGADLIVNASTLGMEGQSPMPATLLDHVTTTPKDGAVVFDMVYAPLETELLAAARRRGLRAIDGLAMLCAQAASSFYAFFNYPAPRDCDAELRALLAS